ncbi:DUF4124 domain-containing protein [soil metagenome]
MRCYIVLFLGVLLTPAHAVTLYRWVDESGTLHFSDQPRPGAEIIEIEGAQTFEAPSVPAPNTSDNAEEPFRYDSVIVVSPREGQTLWNIGGKLDVGLSVVPRLRPEDELRVIYDGNAVEAEGLTFTLPDVYRGTHTLRAMVVGSQGEVLAESDIVTFYVHQTTILTP